MARLPRLKTVAQITGLSESTVCRARACGIDILSDALVKRFAMPGRGRRPRRDLPIISDPAATLAALAKIRDAAAAFSNVPTPQA